MATGCRECLVLPESSQFASGLEQKFDPFMTRFDIYTQYNGGGPGAQPPSLNYHILYQASERTAWFRTNLSFVVRNSTI